MVGLRVQLMLKEYGEVIYNHIPQEEVAIYGTFSANLVGCLTTSFSQII
jgi:hypothetical protein